MEKYQRIATLVSLIVASSWRPANAEVPRTLFEFCSEGQAVRTSVVGSNLVFPWGIAFLTADRWLVTERPGRLREFVEGELSPGVVAGLPSVVNLFDVVVDHRYPDPPEVFLSYSVAQDGQIGLEVASAKLVDHRLRDRRVVFRAEPKLPTWPYSGGKMLLLPDGTLLISVGDAQDSISNAQDISSHLGKVIRINPDGSIPMDNPFNAPGAQREIFTYGHRNVLGLALDKTTGDVWASENGPVGGDELNVLRPGANYGWPLVGYGTPHVSPRSEQPPTFSPEPAVAEWTPALAPSGLAYYSDEVFPAWKSSIFMGSLAQQHVRRVRLNAREVLQDEVLLQDLNERIRDVRVSPDGRIYVLTDGATGRILRLDAAVDHSSTCNTPR